ncbi:MAG: DNA gyrase subunit A [Verrucomicrobiales bacterium]|jgi:DNA gyrase subunit A|nr:DNA gyrase subunit A [Verrucomicrobiales bacterium]
MADDIIPSTSLFAPNEKVQKINVAEEIKDSFLDYSMSVIISRALPDVRDGLKPSQRRILYAMHELNLYPGRKHMKCAKICGDTSGNYHPHGEAVIYPTLVHMAQSWSMRDTLVDPQGNFGSVEGDPPAAMRYTEARLTALGGVLMEDMDKDTVDFMPNYDERLTEPVVFPSAFPNLIVNGGTGIAVGMATNIPPHNLGEVIDGICAVVDHPELKPEGLLKYIKGPDFPTGCSILGMDGIRKYFLTGRGSVKIRGKLHTEEMKGGKEVIIVDEIPYGVNRATLVERIAGLVNEKTLTEITAVRDESDENTRVVIELKRDAAIKVVINNLYKLTALESSFSANMLAIDQRRPKILNIKELIVCYIEHRREVIIRRAKFELANAERRAEVLEGFLIALANMDEFIRLIRESKTRDEARLKLMGYEFTRKLVEKFGVVIRSEARLESGRYLFSEAQIDAILELRLYQLVGLEQEKIRSEYAALLEKITDLMDILRSEQRVLGIIKDELKVIRQKYATPRRTQIVPDEGEMAIEDLIADESMIITLTHNGLIKRTNKSSYRSQRRGGKGVIGQTTRQAESEEEQDFVERMYSASTHDYLMFFTNTGRVYVERVHEIPEGSRSAKGRNIANVLSLQSEEKVVAMLPVESRRGPNNDDVTWTYGDQFVFFATRNGTVKKTSLVDFANTRKGGIIAIGIDRGDTLIEVKLTTGHSEAVLITKEGMSIRFNEEDVRGMGRPAGGVRGISLAKDDEVVALSIVDSNATLLVAGGNGIGKRTSFEEYRLQSRGGKGIITMKTGEKTGAVVGALTVSDSDEIMLITAKGQMVRIPVNGIRECGRNTQGVKLVTLDAGDKLKAIAPVISSEDDADDGQGILE